MFCHYRLILGERGVGVGLIMWRYGRVHRWPNLLGLILLTTFDVLKHVRMEFLLLCDKI